MYILLSFSSYCTACMYSLFVHIGSCKEFAIVPTFGIVNKKCACCIDLMEICKYNGDIWESSDSETVRFGFDKTKVRGLVGVYDVIFI